MLNRFLQAAGFSVIVMIGTASAQQGPARQGDPDQAPALDAKPNPGQPGVHPGRPLMRLLDADHDGTISPQELARAEALLAPKDGPKEGRPDRDEARPPRRQRPVDQGDEPRKEKGPRAGGPFMRLDKNGDGRITFEEFSAILTFAFVALDTNGDGAIDARELQAAPRMMRPHGPDGFGGGRGGFRGPRGPEGMSDGRQPFGPARGWGFGGPPAFRGWGRGPGFGGSQGFEGRRDRDAGFRGPQDMGPPMRAHLEMQFRGPMGAGRGEGRGEDRGPGRRDREEFRGGPQGHERPEFDRPHGEDNERGGDPRPPMHRGPNRDGGI